MQSKEFSSISLICKTVTKKLNQIESRQINSYCKRVTNGLSQINYIALEIITIKLRFTWNVK